MPVEKSWTDQPEAVVEAPILVRGNSRDGLWEVRSTSAAAFVSHGNLFGSQTVECPTLELALRVLNTFLNHPRNGPPPKLPKGAKLLDNTSE